MAQNLSPVHRRWQYGAFGKLKSSFNSSTISPDLIFVAYTTFGRATANIFAIVQQATTIPFSDRNQSRATVRALVVDDFPPFRQFVCSTLGRIPGMQIIGEASDGLEAVQKATELQPDLICLDIGMPTLTESRLPTRYRNRFQPQKSSPSVKTAMRR